MRTDGIRCIDFAALLMFVSRLHREGRQFEICRRLPAVALRASARQASLRGSGATCSARRSEGGLFAIREN